MRIVFMGTPDFAVAPLEYLLLNRCEVTAVYTQPDSPAGRGRTLLPPPVKTAALKWGLPVYQPENLKTPVEITRLAELHPDLIVVAAYGQILRQAVLDIPVYGCLNIHPSLLPRYRGVAPVPAAILNGDTFTGVTIMKLDKGVDTGPVLLQAQVPVSEHDTTGLLTEKLSRIGAQLLVEGIGRWKRGEITLKAQDDNAASYTRMIAKEAGKIDWRKPAVELWRQVRACQPWPGAFTGWQGKQLKIIEARPLAIPATQPGRVIELKSGEAAFGVETGDGILGVVRVQIEGKKVMPADEFLRGQRQVIGATLVSL